MTERQPNPDPMDQSAEEQTTDWSLHLDPRSGGSPDELQDTATGSFQTKADRKHKPAEEGKRSSSGNSEGLQPESEDSAALSRMFRDELERYTNITVVGEGSFGTVLRAYDETLTRDVAIKILKLPHQALAGSFAQEAQRLARLDHPGICRVYDFGTVEDRPYFVTEWLPGASLSSKNLPLDWREACELVASIADALAYAHRKEVVHRDLKPANIMLDEESRIRIIDFGLAIDDAEEQGHEINHCGSPAYMAPEQIDGRMNLMDGRVDIWALGVMLYELVSGKRPFRGPSATDVMTKIVAKPAAPPRTYAPQIPDSLETLILECLEKAPDKRVPTATALADRLRAISAADSNTGSSQKQPSWPSWRRGIIAATVAIAVVTGLAIWAAGRASRSPDDKPVPEQNASAEPSSRDENPPSKASVRSFLQVQGLRPTTGQRWSIDAENPDSPNIETGDRVSLRIRLQEKRYVYLVWFGTDSGTTFLYPGPLGSSHEIGNAEVDVPVENLNLPVGTITPTPSTETVMLLATQKPFRGPDAFVGMIASMPRPSLTQLALPGKFRGIHFDAHQWDEKSETLPGLNAAIQRTVDYLRQELGPTAIIQAVSFVSGKLPASDRSSK